MNRHRRYASTMALVMLMMCAAFVWPAGAQTARTPPVPGVCEVLPKPEDARKIPSAPGDFGEIRLVLAATGGDGEPLLRKRFYLLDKNLQEAGGINWNTLPVREQYFKNASLPLKQWLAKHDCDSLYCPQSEAEYAQAKDTIPEFQKAYKEGMERYKKNPKLALEWITVNFPLKEARTSYYDKKREWVAGATKNVKRVMAVMTDKEGPKNATKSVANFTRVKPGTYYISNVVPLEDGNILWNCEVVVPPLSAGRRQSVTVTFSAPKSPTATPPAKP